VLTISFYAFRAYIATL